MERTSFNCYVGPWESHADEYTHFVRKVGSDVVPEAFEHVYAGRPNEEGLVPFWHTVIFIRDYGTKEMEPELDRIARCFGYKDLGDWAEENSPNPIERDKNGRMKRSAYFIMDWELMSTLIVEEKAQDAGIWVTPKVAERQVRQYVDERTGARISDLLHFTPPRRLEWFASSILAARENREEDTVVCDKYLGSGTTAALYICNNAGIYRNHRMTLMEQQVEGHLFYWCNSMGEINLPGALEDLVPLYADRESILPEHIKQVYTKQFHRGGPMQEYCVTFDGTDGLMMMMTVGDDTMGKEALDELYAGLVTAGDELRALLPNSVSVLVMEGTDPSGGHELGVFFPHTTMSHVVSDKKTHELLSKYICRYVRTNLNTQEEK